MTARFDHVIRNGTLADGNGGEVIEADIAIQDGRIAAVGRFSGSGHEETDARGLLVTPGFVDVHTHYDGQVTWEDRLSPSSDHGVTTVVMGNCGVGFAPCRPADRGALMKLMEGVEDLPEPVLAAGVPWAWESFDEYLDFLDRRTYDIDIATQIPHAAVRLNVMGERALDLEPATDADNAAMAAIARDAILAGALGFSTSRSLNHKSSDGRVTPSYGAAETELTAIARAIGECGTGVLQAISDFHGIDAEEELAMLGRVCQASGRPLSISLLERTNQPGLWRDILDWVAQSNARGMEIRAQVSGRAIGGLMGLELSINPLAKYPAYAEVAELPIDDRVAALRDPGRRARILAEAAANAVSIAALADRLYPLGEKPEYEPGPECFVGARARALELSPLEVLYDLLLDRDGRAMLFLPSVNYSGGTLDVCGEMLRHPNSIVGLGDGGAHLGFLCDAGQPTFILSHWARDRASGRLSLGEAVRALSRDTATALGLGDRGRIAPGYRADINIIDFDRLRLRAPSVTYDLPTGGRRLRQDAVGYVQTMVAGEVVARHGQDTGARPGRLVRGARTEG